MMKYFIHPYLLSAFRTYYAAQPLDSLDKRGRVGGLGG